MHTTVRQKRDGWMIEGGQMLMFAHMVGGWGRQNADMSKKKDKKGKRKFTVATKIMKQKNIRHNACTMCM